MPRRSNEIYHYLVSQKKELGIKIKEKENKNNDKYIMYDLPHIKDGTSIQSIQYALTGHHLSFYEQQVNNNPYLSQYHYTAYLTSPTQNEYRLHVYFDQKDNFKKIQFSLKTGNDTWVEQELTIDLADNIVQWVIDKTREDMIKLRHQYQIFFDDLEKRYIACEKKLTELSKNLNQNRNEYLLELYQAIKLLTSLSHYQQQYEDLYTLFNRIKRSMESAPIAGQDFECMNPVEVKDDSDVVLKEITQETPTSQRSLSKSIEEFVNDAKCAKENFLKIKREKKPYVDQIRLFLKFDESLKNALVLAEQHNLHIVLRLLSECKIEAITLLSGLFVEEKFDEALQLREYINLLSHKLIAKALEKENASLLEFLLKNCDFPINTMKVNSQLPVSYCFEKKSVACLTELIKYGASIVIDAGDGLPIAYHILRESSHPLKKALIDNYEKTIGCSRFNNALRSFVKNSLVNCIDTSKQVSLSIALAKLDQIIKENETLRNGSRSSSVVSYVKQQALSAAHSASDKVANHSDEKLWQALQEDKDIKAKRDELLKVAQEFFSQTSKRTEAQIFSLVGKVLKDTDRFIREENGSATLDKNQVLQALDKFIILYGLLISRQQMQTQPPSVGRRNRNKKNAAKERINEEISSVVNSLKDSKTEVEATGDNVVRLRFLIDTLKKQEDPDQDIIKAIKNELNRLKFRFEDLEALETSPKTLSSQNKKIKAFVEMNDKNLAKYSLRNDLPSLYMQNCAIFHNNVAIVTGAMERCALKATDDFEKRKIDKATYKKFLDDYTDFLGVCKAMIDDVGSGHETLSTEKPRR